MDLQKLCLPFPGNHILQSGTCSDHKSIIINNDRKGLTVKTLRSQKDIYCQRRVYRHGTIYQISFWLWKGRSPAYHRTQLYIHSYSDLFFLITFLLANTVSLFTIARLNGDERAKPFLYLSIVILIFLDVVWLATALINPGIGMGTQ